MNFQSCCCNARTAYKELILVLVHIFAFDKGRKDQPSPKFLTATDGQQASPDVREQIATFCLSIRALSSFPARISCTRLWKILYSASTVFFHAVHMRGSSLVSRSRVQCARWISLCNRTLLTAALMVTSSECCSCCGGCANKLLRVSPCVLSSSTSAAKPLPLIAGHAHPTRLSSARSRRQQRVVHRLCRSKCGCALACSSCVSQVSKRSSTKRLIQDSSAFVRKSGSAAMTRSQSLQDCISKLR